VGQQIHRRCSPRTRPIPVRGGDAHSPFYLTNRIVVRPGRGELRSPAFRLSHTAESGISVRLGGGDLHSPFRTTATVDARHLRQQVQRIEVLWLKVIDASQRAAGKSFTCIDESFASPTARCGRCAP
jgi:hypothetical protein